VATAIKSATGLDIDRHTIATKGHIKKLGTHDVKITLGHNVTAKVSVNVVADK
jgi:large subunit ribosomal protein L9